MKFQDNWEPCNYQVQLFPFEDMSDGKIGLLNATLFICAPNSLHMTTGKSHSHNNV